jgi:four helix bundle protein
VETFEKLEVWRRSKDLAVRICLALKGCRDYGLRDQIQRAAVSVPSNIAEGLERNGRAEYRNFLGIAEGSAGEFRTQLMILQELGYLGPNTGKEMLEESVRISKMLNGLIRTLKMSPRSPISSSRLPPSTFHQPLHSKS